jgi:hypothetical protein
MDRIAITQTRPLTVEPHCDAKLRPVGSKLRLKGRWLQLAGFNPGDCVIVERVAGGLLIRSSNAPFPLPQSASLNRFA